MGNWGNQTFENDSALDVFYVSLQDALFKFRFAIDSENLKHPTNHMEIRAYARIAAAIAGLHQHNEYSRADANIWKRMAIEGLRSVSEPTENWTESEISEWLEVVASDLDELVVVASEEEDVEFEPIVYEQLLERRENQV